MRKIRLQIAPNRSIVLSDIGFSGFFTGDGKVWFRFISNFGLAVLALFVFLFPLLNMDMPRPDSMAVYYLLATVSALLLIALIKISFAGWRELVDPALFIPILLFAFIIISTYLFANPDVRNTLGQPMIKYLSGLVIMCMVGLYYFTAFFVNTQRKFEFVIKALMAGIALVVVSKVLDTSIAWTNISPLIVILLPAIIYATFTATNWFRFVLSLIVTICSIYLVFNFDVNFGVLLGVTLAAAVIAIFSLWFAWDWMGNAEISWSEEFASWRKGKISLIELLETARPLIVVISAVIMLVILIAYVLVNKISPANELSQLIASYRVSFATWSSFQTAALGAGFPAIGTYTLKVSPVADIVTLQGIGGLVAYALLFISAVWQSFKHLKIQADSSVRAWDNFTIFGLFVIFGVGVAAICGYVSIWPMILWWLMLGLYAARDLIAQREHKIQIGNELIIQFRLFSWSSPKIVFGSKLQKLIQFALMILAFVIWVSIVNSVYGLVGRSIL